MPTGHDLVVSARKYRGEPYSTGPQRTSSTSGYKDCSGLVTAANRDIGGPNIGVVSSAQAKSCYDAGGEISVEAAFGIEGALLFMGANRGLNGYGPDGHVAISNGRGGVVETPAWGDTGHAAGEDNARGRRWSGAGLIPGYDYSGAHTGGGVPAGPVDCTPTLKRGSTGVPVKTLQEALVRNGYHLQVDQQFGPATEGAVRDFQAKHGLAVDGVVGDATWAKLLATNPGPALPPAPSGGALPTIKAGSKGDAVKRAQLLLNAKTGSHLAVDGVFGPATTQATKVFQQNVRAFFKLPTFAVDGIIGPATWFWLGA